MYTTSINNNITKTNTTYLAFQLPRILLMIKNTGGI